MTARSGEQGSAVDMNLTWINTTQNIQIEANKERHSIAIVSSTKPCNVWGSVGIDRAVNVGDCKRTSFTFKITSCCDESPVVHCQIGVASRGVIMTAGGSGLRFRFPCVALHFNGYWYSGNKANGYLCEMSLHNSVRMVFENYKITAFIDGVEWGSTPDAIFAPLKDSEVELYPCVCLHGGTSVELIEYTVS